MQNDLKNNFPTLDIEILGVNEFGHESGIPLIPNHGSIPWLQDVDSNGNGISDVWYDSWVVGYRDVFILDEDNVLIGVYNLTSNDLSDSSNYNTLRQVFIDAASNP